MAINKIPTEAIEDDAITTAKVADGAIDTDQLAADAVTDAKIADDSVGLEHLTFAAGAADRFITIDAAGDPTLTTDVGSFNPGDYSLSDFNAPTGTLSMGSQIVRNVADPTNAVDAVNLGYAEANFLSTTSPPYSHYEIIGTLEDAVAQSIAIDFQPRMVVVTWTAPSASYRNSMSVVLTAALNSWQQFDVQHFNNHGSGDHISMRRTASGMDIEYNDGGTDDITAAAIYCLPTPA